MKMSSLIDVDQKRGLCSAAVAKAAVAATAAHAVVEMYRRANDGAVGAAKLRPGHALDRVGRSAYGAARPADSDAAQFAVAVHPAPESNDCQNENVVVVAASLPLMFLSAYVFVQTAHQQTGKCLTGHALGWRETAAVHALVPAHPAHAVHVERAQLTAPRVHCRQLLRCDRLRKKPCVVDPEPPLAHQAVSAVSAGVVDAADSANADGAVVVADSAVFAAFCAETSRPASAIEPFAASGSVTEGETAAFAIPVAEVLHQLSDCVLTVCAVPVAIPSFAVAFVAILLEQDLLHLPQMLLRPLHAAELVALVAPVAVTVGVAHAEVGAIAGLAADVVHAGSDVAVIAVVVDGSAAYSWMYVEFAFLAGMDGQESLTRGIWQRFVAADVPEQ